MVIPTLHVYNVFSLCRCCCCRSLACCSGCVGWLFLCGSSSWLCCCWPSCCPSWTKATAAPSPTTSPDPSTSCSATTDHHLHRKPPKESNIWSHSVKHLTSLEWTMADIRNVDLTTSDPSQSCPLIIMHDCNRPQGCAASNCSFATNLRLILKTTCL